MIRKELEHLAINIDEIHTHPSNVRQGDVGAICESLKAHGQYRAIVFQKSTGRILAGNHTWKAAKALGWTQIAATPVVCDDQQALRILLADNKANDLATYDEPELVELLKQLADTEEGLLGTLFDEDELDSLIADQSHFELPSDVDDVPDNVPAVSKLGDVWLLGDHRVMCGDSLVVANLDLLMNGNKAGCVVTDPPYGIDLNTDYTQMPDRTVKGVKYSKVIGDDKPFDASLLRTYFNNVDEQFWWGANYYRATLSNKDLDGSWLVWDKRNEGSDKVLGSGFELCWSATKHKQDLLRYLWNGFTAKEKNEKRVHPTQKPIALIAEIIERWSSKGCIVVDLFGGSGSTLIAAQETNRVAYLMELDPHYVDVICARYQKHTGNQPVLESTGEPHNFLTDAD
jgi:DNA modification methylase